MKVNRLVIETETDLRKTLDLMYAKAKNDEPFYGLLELMKNEEVILTAVHNIKSNKGSKTKGVDHKTIDDYLQMPKEDFLDIVRKNIDDYQSLPVRRHYIPKGDFKGKFKQSEGKELLMQKKVRSLGIPTIIDRIIQEVTRMAIEPIFEAKFFPHSYGFRPYRSCEHAIGLLTRIVNKSKLYVFIEGDIEAFFDNVNHNKLIEIMWNMGVKDQRVLSIIKRMLKAGIMEEGKLWDNELGTPQGGIMSPLLANIYLNNFDWLVGGMYEYHECLGKYREKKNALASLRARGHSPVFLVRYADDWIIVTDSKENAERIKGKVEKYFNHKLHLNLSPKKTLITDIREEGAKFLGFNIFASKQRFGDMIVARAIPNMEKVNSKVREIARDIRYIRTRKNELEKALDIEKINSKIVGLSNYLKMGISKDVLGTIDNRLEKVMFTTWRKMYGDKYKELKRPVQTFNNRMDRHKGYQLRAFSVNIDDLIVGFTFAKITPIYYAEVFNQAMTPYTYEGRSIYSAKSEKNIPKMRPMLTSPEDIWLYIKNGRHNGESKYNLEYFLNREYTYNRDKGKCKVCDTFLNPANYRCHHINNKLPMNKINKVSNLTSVCIECHKIIHNIDTSHKDAGCQKKILKYREKLEFRKDFETDNSTSLIL